MTRTFFVPTLLGDLDHRRAGRHDCDRRGRSQTTNHSAQVLSLDRRSELPRLAHFAGRGSG